MRESVRERETHFAFAHHRVVFGGCKHFSTRFMTNHVAPMWPKWSEDNLFEQSWCGSGGKPDPFLFPSSFRSLSALSPSSCHVFKQISHLDFSLHAHTLVSSPYLPTHPNLHLSPVLDFSAFSLPIQLSVMDDPGRIYSETRSFE